MMMRPFTYFSERLLLGLLLLLGVAACTPETSPSSSRLQGSAALEAQANAPAEPSAAKSGSARQELRTSLLEIFSGYEHQPTDAELRALGAPAPLVEELVGMRADRDVRTWQRIHALRALRFFMNDDPRVLSHYIALLNSEDISDMELHVSLRSLATGMALAKRHDEALPHLEPWLHAEDYSTRATAIAALRELNTPRARSALRRHAEREQNPELRATVDRALTAAPGEEVLQLCSLVYERLFCWRSP